MESVLIKCLKITMSDSEKTFLQTVTDMLQESWGVDIYLYEQMKIICKQKNYTGVLSVLENDVECKYGRCYMAPSSNG